MAPVQWETERVKAVYEDMVAVLLSTLHPKAERLDGRGGDEGRDVQLRHPDGRLDLHELKSFTGRLGRERGRRRQVEQSLRAAAQHHPDSWTLVVPIDPTPGQLAWFDKLKDQYPFPLGWWGRTWLDQQMATHPAIARYYLEDGDGYVVRVLREFQREQADPAGGLPDALERVGVLRQRLDEVSPHYRLEIIGDAIAVLPRYHGAERDHPILISGGFAFPDTPAGREAAQRLQRALDYGDEVVVEPEHVGELRVNLPGLPHAALAGARVAIGPAVQDPPVPVDARVVLSDPDGNQLGSLPLRFDRRQAGRRGGVLAGQDATGILRLSMRVDHVDRNGKVDFAISPPADDLLPGAMLPTLRVLQHLHAPNRLEVRLGAAAVMHPSPLPPVESISAAYISLLEDLDRVQAFSRTVFAVPRELSHEDIAAIRRAAGLVAGERVATSTGPATANITLRDPPVFERVLLEGEPFAVAFTGDRTETIAGVEVPLGPVVVHAASATVADRDELLAARPWPVGQGVEVAFTPSPGFKFNMWLGDFQGNVQA
jgi:hypothetical protein